MFDVVSVGAPMSPLSRSYMGRPRPAHSRAVKIPEGTQGCFAFVSHAGAQKDLAKSLVEAVESRGMKCWIAPRDIVPGMDYGEQIVLGIRGSEHLLLLFSEESNRSQFCQREVERAVHYRRKILPIRLDGTLPSGPMEFHLSSVQWMDGRAEKDVEVWVDRAIEVLRMPNAAQSPIPSDHKPFRFAGSDVWSPRELARELARNWKIGLSRDFRAMVIRWIEVETGEHSLALNLQDLEKQRLSEEERLSGMLVLMAPEEPLIWKGDTVTLAWTRGNIGEFRTLRFSQVRPVLSNSAQWPKEAIRQLEEGLENVDVLAARAGVETQRLRVERWLLAEDTEGLDHEISLRRQRFPAAKSQALTDLLGRDDLGLPEKVLLASVPEAQFQTSQDLRRLHRIRQSLHAAAGLVVLGLVALGIWAILENRERATAVRFSVSVSGKTPEEMGVVSGTILFELDGSPFLFQEGPMAVRSGLHRIRIADHRFKSWVKEFRVSPAKLSDLGSFDLVQVWGEVLVETDPPGATVLAANGKKIGVTPLRLAQVEPGNARFRVALSPHGSATLEGTVQDGSVLVLRHLFNTAAADAAGKELSSDETPPGVETPTSSANFLALLAKAESLGSGGDLEAAERLVRQALGGLEKLEGAEHPDTLRALAHLVDLLTAKVEYPEAERLGRRSLAGLEKVLGPDHRRTLVAAYDLAAILALQGDRVGAEPLFARSLAGLDRTLDPDRANDPRAEELYERAMGATAILEQGEVAEAEARFRRLAGQLDKPAIVGGDFVKNLSLEESMSRANAAYMVRVMTLGNLSLILNATGRSREAVPLLRRHGAEIDGNLRYNLVCSECLAGNLDEAKRLVARELADDPDKASKAQADPDLAAIRDYIASLVRLARPGEANP